MKFRLVGTKKIALPSYPHENVYASSVWQLEKGETAHLADLRDPLSDFLRGAFSTLWRVTALSAGVTYGWFVKGIEGKRHQIWDRGDTLIFKEVLYHIPSFLEAAPHRATLYKVLNTSRDVQMHSPLAKRQQGHRNPTFYWYNLGFWPYPEQGGNDAHQD